ncbi:hypothetical protein [Actinoplanes sp. NPDC049802]|uniref:hypothetical protein n=1 Tax=Actinoplanes sp. NPDC049802 TaxID=3154742 RepID=UPI0033CABD07
MSGLVRVHASPGIGSPPGIHGPPEIGGLVRVHALAVSRAARRDTLTGCEAARPGRPVHSRTALTADLTRLAVLMRVSRLSRPGWMPVFSRNTALTAGTGYLAQIGGTPNPSGLPEINRPVRGAAAVHVGGSRSIRSPYRRRTVRGRPGGPRPANGRLPGLSGTLQPRRPFAVADRGTATLSRVPTRPGRALTRLNRIPTALGGTAPRPNGGVARLTSPTALRNRSPTRLPSTITL